MTLWRRLVAGATLIVGGLWLTASFDLIALPERTFQAFWTAFLILWAIGIIMDWRSRKKLQYKEPSPARSAVGVIVATGAVAVVITARAAQSASQYIFPASIVIVTTLLAFAAFRFASKHQNHIGEARFDTTSNGS